MSPASPVPGTAAVVASMLLAASLSQPASAQRPGAPDAAGASAPPAPRMRNPAPPAHRTPGDPSAWVSVWVDLDLPELASLPRDQQAEREALRLRISAQQDQVMASLRALGAQEQARIQQVRNTLAVRLPATQIEAARLIPGVRALRVVRDVDRGPLTQGP